MVQRIVVDIIILAAAVLAGILLFHRFSKPQKCTGQDGCADCPLAETCKEKEDKEKGAESE